MPRKKKLLAPDWKNGRTVRGAEAATIEPFPYVLRFPNSAGIRQTVTVDLHSWRGVSFGASHYNAQVRPEQNMVWDGVRGEWRLLIDCPDTKHFRYDCAVATREEAVKFIEVVLRTFFSDEARYQVENTYAEGVDAVLENLRESERMPTAAQNPLDGD